MCWWLCFTITISSTVHVVTLFDGNTAVLVQNCCYTDKRRKSWKIRHFLTRGCSIYFWFRVQLHSLPWSSFCVTVAPFFELMFCVFILKSADCTERKRKGTCRVKPLTQRHPENGWESVMWRFWVGKHFPHLVFSLMLIERLSGRQTSRGV